MDEVDNALSNVTLIEAKAEKIRTEIIRKPMHGSRSRSPSWENRQQNQLLSPNYPGEDAGVSTSLDVTLAETELEDVVAKKQVAIKELRILQEAVKKNREELKTSETELHECRERYDRDLAALEKKTDEVRAELETASSKLKSTEGKFENRMNVNTSKVESIIQENEELRSRVEKHDKYKLHFETEILHQKEKALSEVKAKNLKIESLNEELEDISLRNEELEKENSILSQNMNQSERELKEQIMRVNHESHALKIELESKIEDLGKQLQESQQGSQVLQDKVSELNQIISQKEKEILNENQRRINSITEKKSEITRLKTIIQDSVSALDSRSGSQNMNTSSSKDINIEGLAHDLKSLTQQKSNMKESLEKLEKELSTSQDEISKLRSAHADAESQWRQKLELLDQQLRSKNKESDTYQRDSQRREDELKHSLDRLVLEYESKIESLKSSFEHKEAMQQDRVKNTEDNLKRKEQDLIIKIENLNKELGKEKEQLSKSKNDELSLVKNEIETKSKQEIEQMKRNAETYYTQLAECQLQLQTAKKNEQKLGKEIVALEKTVEVELEHACKTLCSVLNVSVPINYPPVGMDNSRKLEIFSKLALLRALTSELHGFVDSFNKHCDQLKQQILVAEQKSREEIARVQKRAKADKSEAVTKLRESTCEEYFSQIEDLQKLVEFEKENAGKIRKQLRQKDEALHSMKITMNDWKEKVTEEVENSIRENMENEIAMRMQKDNLVNKSKYLEKEREVNDLKEEISYMKIKVQTHNESPSDFDPERDSSNHLVQHLRNKNRQLQLDNMQYRLKANQSAARLNDAANCHCQVCMKRKQLLRPGSVAFAGEAIGPSLHHGMKGTYASMTDLHSSVY